MTTALRSLRPSQLCALLVAFAAACGGSDSLGSDQQSLTGTHLRILDGNLTTGNNQSYEAPGLDIFQGLHPDVALVQEFNYKTNSQADLDEMVHTAFGPAYSYFRESGPAVQIPNGVVSRYPIVSSGAWADPKVSNRSFAWAKIQLPGGQFLWAVSLHLLTSGATNRDAEAKALVSLIQQNVPAGDYLVVGGDFNTGTRTEACVVTLAAVVQTAGPFPADNHGNQDTSGTRSKPHDWLLAAPDLEALKTPVVIGSASFTDGLVVDTRVYTPLSDIAPAQQGDSGASNMQHMAVVRDFLVPGGAPPPPPPPPADGFEPDDTRAQAHAIALGVAQVHDLSPATDVDWVTFTLAAVTNVKVQTSGPTGGDTVLWLYDAAGTTQLAMNDDGGAGKYSLIKKAALPAGTYSVKVTSKNSATVIKGYSLKVSAY